MDINDKKILELEKGTLLDVRETDEWNEGHLPNAIHTPLSGLVLNKDSFITDKSKTYYIYCLSGGRAQRAVMELESKGFKAENIGGVMYFDGDLVK